MVGLADIDEVTQDISVAQLLLDNGCRTLMSAKTTMVRQRWRPGVGNESFEQPFSWKITQRRHPKPLAQTLRVNYQQVPPTPHPGGLHCSAQEGDRRQWLDSDNLFDTSLIRDQRPTVPEELESDQERRLRTPRQPRQLLIMQSCRDGCSVRHQHPWDRVRA